MPNYGFELNNGIRLDDIEGWCVRIPENSALWNQPSNQLVRALTEAKNLLPCAKELRNIDITLWATGIGNSGVAPHTISHIEKSKADLKNVENNPLADEETKKFARDILEQYAQYQARRGLQRNVKSTLRRKVIARDKSTCRYCGRELDKKNIHIDHVVPYSLGGRTELDNLVVACDKCNLKKSGRTLEEANMKIINDS